jgi:hypothetical protein
MGAQSPVQRPAGLNRVHRAHYKVVGGVGITISYAAFLLMIPNRQNKVHKNFGRQKKGHKSDFPACPSDLTANPNIELSCIAAATATMQCIVCIVCTVHCTELHCALHCAGALHCAMYTKYCVPHCTALPFTALHCTIVMQCSAAHFTALHCNALHCTALLSCSAIQRTVLN